MKKYKDEKGISWKEEFNLSDKRGEFDDLKKEGFYYEKNVKEFIKIITKPLLDLTIKQEKKDYYNFIMDKAGDKFK